MTMKILSLLVLIPFAAIWAMEKEKAKQPKKPIQKSSLDVLPLDLRNFILKYVIGDSQASLESTLVPSIIKRQLKLRAKNKHLLKNIILKKKP